MECHISKKASPYAAQQQGQMNKQMRSQMMSGDVEISPELLKQRFEQACNSDKEDECPS